MEKKPLVSIGLPVYNGENFLVDALGSIVEQTYENLEIVVGDNCSTDDTATICRDFAAIERCVEVLVDEPEYVLVFGRALHIDSFGSPQEEIDHRISRMGSSNPALRFRPHLLHEEPGHAGVRHLQEERRPVRHLLDLYVGSDRGLLAELALAGPW